MGYPIGAWQRSSTPFLCNALSPNAEIRPRIVAQCAAAPPGDLLERQNTMSAAVFALVCVCVTPRALRS